LRGCFVTGTDTGVGKTVLAAAIVAAMRAAGVDARAFKPVVTGTDPAQAVGDWPADDVLLGAVAGISPLAVAPLRFGPPVSPHFAAQLAGALIDPAALVAAAREAGAAAEALVVEGVGGLLVPLAEHYSVRDFACELGLPLVVAARPGLGTINHTLLTVEAARAAGLDVRAVVLGPWPDEGGSPMHRSNRDTIERLGGVAVITLAHVRPEPPDLARAGQTLPWRKWLTA
jgi:dethiobiotin synthetase